MGNRVRNMRGVRGTFAMVILLVAEPATAAGVMPKPLADQSCTLQAGGEHTVVRIVDAETIELDDGTEVRLVGALAPGRPPFISGDAVWPPEAAALAALSELLLGHRVELAFAGRRVDRWGRLLAHVFRIGKAASREWVQGYMLSHGHARADALPGSVSCLTELLAHERVAMRADVGLWTNPAYRIRWADTPQRLMRLRNSFQLVEGRVRKVAVTRARIYLNFGDDWRSDFTAGAKLSGPDFTKDTVATLQRLEGRRVRVRGWIERRNGPYIELFHPLQIEDVDAEDLPPSAGLAGGGTPPADKGHARSPAAADPGEPLAPPDKEKRPEREVPGALDL